MRELRTEEEIIQNWQGDINNPIVSICCITYNHEPYIEDALEGFLMQETDFPYEILIHDDASPDRTAEIICQYHKLYPRIIKPVYQTENKYSAGVNPNLEYNYPRAKGEYIAMCEGDDYWTNSRKLAKQIQFLEKNKNIIGSAHNVRVIDEHGNLVKKHPYKLFGSYTYSLAHAEELKLPGQTASIVYRNIWKDVNENTIESYRLCKTNGDQKLALLLTLLGDVYCFTDIMADHRKIRSSGTSWSASTYKRNLSLYKYNSLIELNKFSQDAFGVKLNNKKARLKVISSSLMYFVKHQKKENWLIIKEILSKNKKNNDKYSEIFFQLLSMLFFKLIGSIRRLFIK